ncbi:MAG TPA: hypothetical protein VEW47_04105 [Candidatus Dormibacteraeota bacterium]|nr:hypothetical protein [Candidatus Dormibacteraeota bacterium]
MAATPEKDRTNQLPYRTTKEKFEKAIQVLRQSQTVDALDVAVGQSDRPFILRTLGILGMADPKTLKLTDMGLRIAYATENDRPLAVLRGILGFAPFKIALLELARRKSKSVSVADLVGIWGEREIGINDAARDGAALVLCSMMETAGLGTFYAGRRGSVSRVDVQADLQDRLVAALGAPQATTDKQSQEPRSQDDRNNGRDSDIPIERTVRPEAGFVRHNYQLRRGMVINLDLPEDLTTKEVDRLTKWLATLPLEDQGGG